MDSPFLKFKFLHNQLQQILIAQVFDEELIHKKITKYIGYMVQDKVEEQQKMFDYFCEYNGVEIFSNLMSGDPLLAIKSYSLLFINLKNEMWISYILCQPFFMKAIGLKCDSRDEQYTEYFVSFLKSLSIRINSSQITLFYNKKNCTFPLVMAAMKYFNHPDFMVRTSVMNVILELMKNKEKKAQEYFSRFPFTSYLINFACEVNALITLNHNKISEQNSVQQLVAKHMTNYKVDISDYLYYFNDLIQFATPKAIEIIEQTIVSYLIIPIFKWLLQQNKTVRNHALLLIHECLRIIKNKTIVNTLVMLLFSQQLNEKVIVKISKFQAIYKPQIFNKEFNVQNNYWGEYEDEVVGHCLEIFKDVQKFEVDYEEYKHSKNSKFKEQIDKISNFIGYDLLKNTFLQQKFIELIYCKQNILKNPFKMVFVQLLKNSQKSWDIITSIYLNILTNNYISKDVLEICGLKIISSQLQPQKDVKNQFNILQKLKNSIIQRISSINWDSFTFTTLCNSLTILKLLTIKEQSIQFQQILLQKDREIANLLKQFTVPQNMILVVDQFITTFKRVKEVINRNPCEVSIPYTTIFVSQEKWDQDYVEYLLPNKIAQKIVHFISHFFLFRSFVTQYFIKFYEAEYPDFQQLYQSTFSSTTHKWKKNLNYKINSHALISCFLQTKQSKKNKKVMIIEDKLNFVLAELNEKLCTILINENWKNMWFEINKEDGTCIDVRVNNNNGVQKSRLIFEDQVRCNTTLVRLNDIKWQYYQYELSFINKFIKSALQQ